MTKHLFSSHPRNYAARLPTVRIARGRTCILVVAFGSSAWIAESLSIASAIRFAHTQIQIAPRVAHAAIPSPTVCPAAEVLTPWAANTRAPPPRPMAYKDPQ